MTVTPSFAPQIIPKGQTRFAGRIVWAWVLTIPLAATIAAISYFVILLVDKVVGQ